jgi:hypothetical protein
MKINGRRVVTGTGDGPDHCAHQSPSQKRLQELLERHARGLGWRSRQLVIRDIKRGILK